MLERTAIFCFFALLLATLMAGCASGPEFGCAPGLASEMTRQEVREVLAQDPSLTAPMTFVRKDEGGFKVAAPGLSGWIFWVSLPERYMAQRPEVFARPVQTIEARQTEGDHRGFDVLYTYYDAALRLVYCHEATYDMHERDLIHDLIQGERTAPASGSATGSDSTDRPAAGG